MVKTILMALVAGAIVGPLARLALPGRQNMTLGLTIGLGAIGSLIGAFIYSTPPRSARRSHGSSTARSAATATPTASTGSPV